MLWYFLLHAFLLRNYCGNVCLKHLSFISWATSTQRQAAQCVGRVIRSKADYGMMIFADKR